MRPETRTDPSVPESVDPTDEPPASTTQDTDGTRPGDTSASGKRKGMHTAVALLATGLQDPEQVKAFPHSRGLEAWLPAKRSSPRWGSTVPMGRHIGHTWL
jgi:hypothetical protein